MYAHFALSFLGAWTACLCKLSVMGVNCACLHVFVEGVCLMIGHACVYVCVRMSVCVCTFAHACAQVHACMSVCMVMYICA